MSVPPRRAPVPRAALLGIVAATVSHLAAVITALASFQSIAAWHWAVMMCSDAVLAVVVVSRAEWFLTRTFRLPGVFVVSTCIIILVPLPLTVRRYGRFVPEQTVLSIAVGLAALAVVLFVLTAKPLPALRVSEGPSDAVVPWAIVGLAVILLPIWIRAIGTVPLFELFGGTDALTAAGERDRALDSLSSGGLRTAVGSLRNLYLMFATGYVVARAATVSRADWRRLARWRLVAGGVLFVSAVYALLTTERAILGELVIVVVVAWLVSRRQRLSVRHIAVSAVAGITFPVMYAVLVASGGISGALVGLKRRILYLPDDVMLHYFIAFPRYHAFLHGTSIPKLGRFSGAATFDLSSFIYDKYYKVDASLTGIANGSFLGVGWANWGTAGVVLFCVATAAALVLAERLLGKMTSVSSAALRGVAVVQTVLLTSSDVNRSLLGFLPGFLDIVAVMMVARAVDRRFGRRRVDASPTFSVPPAVRFSRRTSGSRSS